MFLETGKVVGQNGTRLAGQVRRCLNLLLNIYLTMWKWQVIVGVSAAFLAWDVIDLGWNVAELVRMKGSQVRTGKKLGFFVGV